MTTRSTRCLMCGQPADPKLSTQPFCSTDCAEHWRSCGPQLAREALHGIVPSNLCGDCQERRGESR